MSKIRTGNVLPFDLTSGFEYWLLPGNCPPGFQHTELHNRAFQLWRVFWTEVLQQVSGEKVRSEDFWRQRLICIVTRGDEIAAVHLSSFFNLESEAALSHSYLRNYYDEEDFSKLKELGAKSVMSIEYLTVSPTFRNSTIGFPVVSLLMGLGGRVFENSGYDAVVAPCRTDLKVDVRAVEFGGQPISQNYVYQNFPVINMTLLRNKLTPHADPRVNQMIDNLWSKRRDHSGFQFTQDTKTKKTAA